MHGYIDLADEAERLQQEREARRRRTLAGIRGCLRSEASPRWLTFRAFLISAVPGAMVAWMAYRCGVEPWGKAPALGILAMWPVFVYLAKKTADGLGRELRVLDNLQINAAHDMSLDVEENRVVLRSEFWHDFWESFWNSFWRESSKLLGNGGIMGFLVLGLLTMGTWIVWELVRYGPTLLAEILLDGSLAERYPHLAKEVPLQSWKGDAFAATALYFIWLAVVVAVLGGVLGCIPLTGWGRP